MEAAHFPKEPVHTGLCISQFQQCPSPPRANPRALAFFKKIGRIPRGGDEKRGQMPRPRDRRLPTLLQFFYKPMNKMVNFSVF